MSDSRSTTRSGIGIGAIVAAILSWSVNHSILWALVHGFFGWFYLIYYVIFK